MYIDAGFAVFSPSDLSAFLSCRHRIGLDLAMAHGVLAEPAWSDPPAQSLRDRGLAHERAYVEWLCAQGLQVVDVSEGNDRDAQTRQALAQGADVVYQARLSADGWRGYADILRRVERPSVLGAWSYEVHDTKLARETRGGTVLQLATYSELLAAIQGTRPEHFHVVTPAGAGTPAGEPFQIHSYRVDDFAAYHRRIRQQLADTVARGHDAIRDAHYPEPVEVCELCRWWDRCNARRRADDHLSFIAGIGRTQRTELMAQGVVTLEAAAAMPVPLAFTPSRGSHETYGRLRDQARVQHRQRTLRQPVHELLTVAPGLGLSRLPEPSPGDLFLDLEGARFAREGGREYLFGLWSKNSVPGKNFTVGDSPQPERQTFLGTGPEGGLSPDRRYCAWWAHDDAGERAAFEAVIDTIRRAIDAHPGAHVYHFGHYESSTFKRLMGRHATRANELDELLRGERFVDLHQVVRQALRAGVESYSIKQLEQFYGFTREVPLKDAGQHLQAIEMALEARAPQAIPPTSRAAVQGYNQDDCRSTEALRDWLESLRAQLVDGGTAVPRPEPKASEPPEDIGELEALQQAMREKLLAGLPAEASDDAHPDHPRWLLAYLIDWHRREDKAQWWEYFRLAAMSAEELAEERAAIVGLQFVERVGEVLNKRTKKPTGSVIDRYTYPFQETDIGTSGDLEVVGGVKFGSLEKHDRQQRAIDVKKGRDEADVHPVAVFHKDIVRTDVLQQSLLRVCEDIGPPTCATDLLFRRSPRLTSGVFERLVFESEVDFAVRLATTLDRTTLSVQGPPGSGKTYLGAQMIRALVRVGRKVGVVAASHKVIRNLLEAVRVQAADAAENVRLGHKCDPVDDVTAPGAVRELKGNPDALQAITGGDVDVLGGTAWLWARPEFAATVDVLFVDEAGQMSLANALAVSPAAQSLVLLGDPQQLEQPQKGSHPDGVDVSALQHVLGHHETMPPERGLFLAETWRLAPAVCAFTSELFYEGKLRPHEGLERQVLTGAGEFDGAGLWWVPVTHDGNRNWAAEELDAVSTIADRLLVPGAQWVNAKGDAAPLTGDDILVVAPYNAHVNRLAERLITRGVRVGTVDKFQGQEAPVVIYAMAASSPDDAPRGMEFLYSLNRLNVATSRARCAAIVVASPRLLEPECRTPAQMRLANALCRFVEYAARRDAGSAPPDRRPPRP